jgi:eukaryotic-like serine/threonine-protein kinase
MSTAPPSLGAGTRLGHYRLLRELGRGSTGAVHAARDRDSGAIVALKVLSLGSDLDSRALTEARTRFTAEAAAAQGLSHPHIVAVLDSGSDGTRAWLAMELVPGTPLSRYTDARRLLPEALSVSVAERLADALAHAHRAGVVHRDVKPANVLVDWPSDSIKLADFGLARLADAEATRTGLMLGSPAFMAPELLAGGVPDARSDLYALGTLLFQLLTARLPHEGASMGELLRQVANDPAPDLRSLRPDLPPALAALVARLLIKRAAERPRDGLVVAEGLRRIGEQLPPPPGVSGEPPLT